MKLLVCDICGKQIKDEVYCLSLPYLYGGKVYQSYDVDDAEDLCADCAYEFYKLTEDFRKSKAGEHNDM